MYLMVWEQQQVVLYGTETEFSLAVSTKYQLLQMIIFTLKSKMVASELTNKWNVGSKSLFVDCTLTSSNTRLSQSLIQVEQVWLRFKIELMSYNFKYASFVNDEATRFIFSGIYCTRPSIRK